MYDPLKPGLIRKVDKETDTAHTSASARKLLDPEEEFDVPINENLKYVILSFIHVFSVLATFVKCSECSGKMQFSRSCQKGLGFQIVVTCPCSTRKINSCKRVGSNYEVNHKIVFVMRLIGVGINGLSLFCAFMDLSQNFSKYTYYNSIQNIKFASKKVYELVIYKAAKEEKILTAEKGLDDSKLFVSRDGTWAKRGFSSLIGVATIIGKFSGKVLDAFISSKRCHQCESMKNRLEPTEFLIWKESEHAEECQVNYEGSSGGMEVQ